MPFDSVFKHSHLYVKSLVVFLSLYTLPLLAQNENPAKIKFGDFAQFNSSFGYIPFETEVLNTYHLRYFDQSASVSLYRRFSLGLNYSHIDVNDSFRNRNTFFRAGTFLRFQDFSVIEKWVYSFDFLVNYGDLVIELDEELNKREVFYLGFKADLGYKVVSQLYVLAGYKYIRQLEWGDYGLENYGYIGLSYRLPRGKR
jgi:hypothetical protein